MILQDVDGDKSCCYKTLMAKKSRGQFSISQRLLDELRRYVNEENKEDRLKRLSNTAVIEAGLIGFFEATEEKRRDLLSAAFGGRIVTALGKRLASELGVAAKPQEDRPAPKKKAAGKA